MSILAPSKIHKGRWAEQWVARKLAAKNYQILFSDLKTPWAQIDLLVQSKPGCLQIIEVKYLSEKFDPEVRLGFKQKLRLLRAQQFLEAQHRCSVGLFLALVSPGGQCRFVEIQA